MATDHSTGYGRDLWYAALRASVVLVGVKQPTDLNEQIAASLLGDPAAYAKARPSLAGSRLASTCLALLDGHIESVAAARAVKGEA